MKDYKKPTETIVESLELPQDLFLGLPNISLIGNRRMSISNHRGILSYDQNEIVILAKHMQLKITGRSLAIELYSQDEIMIKGYISSIGMD